MAPEPTVWRSCAFVPALVLASIVALATGDERVQIVKPACDLRVAHPPVRGSIREHEPGPKDAPGTPSMWQFTLEADCNYALWDGPHTMDCLKGVWTVTVGASQTNIWTSQLANLLVPGTLITKLDNFSIDGVFTQLLDVVIRDGKVVYKNVVTDITDQRIGAHTLERDQAVLRDAFAQVSKAPKFRPGDVRITNFFAEYWDNIEFALEAVESATDWDEAEVTLVTTIGLWYVNSLGCNGDASWCATRPSLGTLSREDLVKQFNTDMKPVVESLERFCLPGGRAGQRGCAVASIDHCQFMQGDIWHETHDAIQNGLKGHTSSHLRYIDLWSLTMQIPEDCIGGHQSPMSTLWTWQVLLGGICNPQDAAEGSFASFDGNMCRSAQVNDECPDPHEKGFKYAWECGLSELCSIAAHNPPDSVRTLVVADGVVNVDFVEAAKLVEDTWSVEYHRSAEGYRWYITLLIVALATLVTASTACSGSVPEGKTYRPVAPIDNGDLQGSDRQAGKNWAGVDVEQRPSSPREAPTETTEPERRRGPPEKFAFGLARCVASMHVVAGHLYAFQATADVYLFSWGFTWVPWFFMLSGFILFSAEARNPRSESMLDYVARRAVTVYPLYAVSMLMSLGIAKTRCEQPSQAVLVLQAWLGQAWVPHVTERTLQMQCWFLSCLVLYWAAFQPLFRCVSSFDVCRTVLTISAIFVLPWAVVGAPLLLGTDMLWFNDHSFGHAETNVDVAVIFLKFHPFCYLHVFALGMLLARLRNLLERHSGTMVMRCMMEVMAPLGYIGLGCLFCVHSLRLPAAKLSARLGVLLPLQSCIMLGLAGMPGQEMPLLASLAGKLNFLEQYSYAVYVLQFICWRLWPSNTAGISFFIFLAAAAVVVVHTVQKPSESLARKNHKLLWVAPVFISVALVGMTYLPDLECSPDLPSMLQVDDRLVDVRLPIQAAQGEGAVLINPSLLFQGDDVVIVARQHRRQTELTRGTYKGLDVAVIEETWHSDIVMGTVGLGWDDWDKWLLSGQPPKLPKLPVWTGLRTPDGSRWAHLCARETWVPENQTLVRLVVTGPEDPKVFQSFSDSGNFELANVSVAFSSYPPLGRDGCESGGAVPQMYLANTVHPDDPAKRTTGKLLECGGKDKRAEKNWIPFDSNGQLHFVYSVLPHVVIGVEDDGSCGEHHSTNFAPLVRLQEKLPGVAIRGSAQAVLIDDAEATPSLPEPHYLALLHIVDPHTHRYAHFAYRFSTQSPFDIIQVSEQLPLRAARPDQYGQAFAFASGLAVRDRQVVISYAAGDRDPRAMMLTLWRLDRMFESESEIVLDQDASGHNEEAVTH